MNYYFRDSSDNFYVASEPEDWALVKGVNLYSPSDPIAIPKDSIGPVTNIKDLIMKGDVIDTGEFIGVVLDVRQTFFDYQCLQVKVIGGQVKTIISDDIVDWFIPHNSLSVEKHVTITFKKAPK